MRVITVCNCNYIHTVVTHTLKVMSACGSLAAKLKNVTIAYNEMRILYLQKYQDYKKLEEENALLKSEVVRLRIEVTALRDGINLKNPCDIHHRY